MQMISGLLKYIPAFDMDTAKKKASLIIAAALLLIFILYFFLLLKPSLGKLNGLMPRVRAVKTRIKTTKEELRHEGELKAERQRLVESLAGYEKRLSREKEVPMLLENMSRMAKESRVKILGITPIDKRAKQNVKEGEEVYNEVPIAIRAQGGYHELGNFINKLEKGRRYIQISDIKIAANSTNPKRHSVGLVVYAYTFKQ